VLNWYRHLHAIGRVAEALELCRECGQPWRAASLGGGGAFGPTPLGPAAAAADAADPSDQLADELADQVKF
jgi:nuclear pore complex protein Nup107